MGKYVDGFVIPLPKANLEAYRKMATLGGSIWREYGALDYVECIADDVKPGDLTSFPQSVLLKEDETVVFAWITYKSREDRDRINALVMNDPRLHTEGDTMPFDPKRMVFGGFEVLVQT